MDLKNMIDLYAEKLRREKIDPGEINYDLIDMIEVESGIFGLMLLTNIDESGGYIDIYRGDKSLYYIDFYCNDKDHHGEMVTGQKITFRPRESFANIDKELVVYDVQSALLKTREIVHWFNFQ